MPAPRKRRWPRIAVGYAGLVLLLALVTVPVAFVTPPAHRPLVIRIAAAILVAVVALHTARSCRTCIEAQPASDFDRALEPPPRASSLGAQFVELRDELSDGASSAQYFERVLWPRLRAINRGRTDGGASSPLLKPAARSFRRGPSLRSLASLIDSIGKTRQ